MSLLRHTHCSSVQRSGGFTLVEIAIVLVIIGLLLSGVLKGQELLFNNKIKATFNLAQSVSEAFLSYRDRYGQIPGDDRVAAAHFPAATPRPVNGDGNGVLSFGDCAKGAITENCQALYELRLAGLLPGTGTAPIDTPFGGAAFPAAGSSVINGLGPGPVLAFYPRSLTMKAAAGIDAAFDDGNPATGTFRCNGMAYYAVSTPDALIEQYCALTL